MHFDHLDEIYAMVKSILHFEQIHQNGLTGFPSCANFGRQCMPPIFFW